MAFDAYGVSRCEETFSCNYELNPEYSTVLERSGLVVSGVSSDGGARIIEVPPHWFVGTGFLPQLSSEPGKPHPLIVAYLKAAVVLKTKRAQR
jgi:CTP synthase (UTP-ammonia lyase)